MHREMKNEFAWIWMSLTIIVTVIKMQTIFLWQWKVINLDIYLENYRLSSDICAINSLAADIQEIFAKSHHVFHTDPGRKT